MSTLTLQPGRWFFCRERRIAVRFLGFDQATENAVYTHYHGDCFTDARPVLQAEFPLTGTMPATEFRDTFDVPLPANHPTVTHGIMPGDRVSVMLDNRRELVGIVARCVLDVSGPLVDVLCAGQTVTRHPRDVRLLSDVSQ